MLKRARRIWTVPGSDVENVVHGLTVDTDHLRLESWYLQGDGINRPGEGGAGGNRLGEELAPRLTGMLLTPMGDVTLDWNPATMRDGAVHYLSTLYNGSPAPEAFKLLEIDAMAALCPTELRPDAAYPHWDHKQYVYIFDFVDHICTSEGIGLVPVVKIVTDGDGTGGFTNDDVIVEARLGPLGFVGEFDHTDAANGVTYRDARATLPDGSPNPDQAFFTLPSPMPQDWEFG
ncbi:MAG: hypothetical protein CMM61_11900 [Rhodospirillaceae bacterium]|nr:hypothetical protein [Rhodospirillaceae bacterium]